jgi:hypothetical protein
VTRGDQRHAERRDEDVLVLLDVPEGFDLEATAEAGDPLVRVGEDEPALRVRDDGEVVVYLPSVSALSVVVPGIASDRKTGVLKTLATRPGRPRPAARSPETSLKPVTSAKLFCVVNGMMQIRSVARAP